MRVGGAPELYITRVLLFYKLIWSPTGHRTSLAKKTISPRSEQQQQID